MKIIKPNWLLKYNEQIKVAQNAITQKSIFTLFLKPICTYSANIFKKRWINALKTFFIFQGGILYHKQHATHIGVSRVCECEWDPHETK